MDKIDSEFLRTYFGDRHVYAVMLVTPDGRKTLISTPDHLHNRIVGLSDDVLAGHSEIYFHEI